MENQKRRFLGNRSAVMSTPQESCSVFHIVSCEDSVRLSIQDCYQGIEEFCSALKNFDGAGTHLTESLAQALRGTHYQRAGEQLAGGFREVYGSQQSQCSLEQLKEMENVLLAMEKQSSYRQEEMKPFYAQTACHILLLFVKLQKQYFQICHQKMADLVHHLLSAKDLEYSGEVAKIILKLDLAEEISQDKTITSLPSSPWSSPKLRKASQGSAKTSGKSTGFKLFSLFERKSSPDEGKSSFYVCMPEQADDKEPEPKEEELTAGSQNTPTVKAGVLPGSVPLVTMTDEMNNVVTADLALGQPQNSSLASEEDLDSVINLLSGINSISPVPSPSSLQTPGNMHSLSEDPFRDPSPSTPNSMHSVPELQPPPSRSPMQLTVPNLYRMPSPASDTQVEELKSPRPQLPQIHRRSEGCLDLSSVGRNLWPHQHHRSSLPAVQPYSLQHNLDTMPDSIYGVGHFFPPAFVIPSQAPPGYLGSGGIGTNGSSKTGNIVGCNSVLSNSQWSYGGMENRNNGTWPLYHPMGLPPSRDWISAQEGSDGSDNSSNGDHFFAVGKDLAQAIECRHDSSDEEQDGTRNKYRSYIRDRDGQIGCTNTWPMMQHVPASTNHHLPGLDFLELPDSPPSTHRPLQMQWSDPMSSRSMWPASSTNLQQHRTSQSMHGFTQHN